MLSDCGVVLRPSTCGPVELKVEGWSGESQQMLDRSTMSYESRFDENSDVEKGMARHSYNP